MTRDSGSVLRLASRDSRTTISGPHTWIARNRGANFALAGRLAGIKFQQVPDIFEENSVEAHGREARSLPSGGGELEGRKGTPPNASNGAEGVPSDALLYDLDEDDQ